MNAKNLPNFDRTLLFFLLVKSIGFREITLFLPIVFAYDERMIAQNLS